MRLCNLSLYLLITIGFLNLAACSLFYSTPSSDITQNQDTSISSLDQEIVNNSLNQDIPKSEQLNWLEAFNLNPTQRQAALMALNANDTRQESWLRCILLTHVDASLEELQEAESCLQSHDLSKISGRSEQELQLHEYLIKLNKALQDKKLVVLKLQEQIAAYKRFINKQGQEKEVLENKIEALTEIEHQINLRSDNNAVEVSP